MSVKPPAAARWAAVPMILLLAVALIDDLGNFRWFWPYDRQVLGIGFLVGLLWYWIFGPQMHEWVAEVRAQKGREEDGKI